MNCYKFKLSRDIEENPGPTFVDPSKTIDAPYSQGNVDVFGPNAGVMSNEFVCFDIQQ